MSIRDRIQTMKGDFEVEYFDIDSFDDLPHHFHRSAGLCIYQDQMVMCRARDGKVHFPGGSVEAGETVEQALIREVHEESNMRVLQHVPIGYQKIWSENQQPLYQAFFYARVEPYGPFEADPGGGHITGIFFEPIDALLAQQIDGTRGKRMIERAVEKHRGR